jgi:hypothetical protein
MAARLEQQDGAPTRGKLARDHPAAGAGADDDDLEALAHAPTPMYDQSLAMRIASGE